MAAMKKIRLPRLHSSTAPGYTNPNQQTVIRATGAASNSFVGQSVYELQCGLCSGTYGSNGNDNHHRRCPLCQAGKPGEPVRRPDNLSLFGE